MLVFYAFAKAGLAQSSSTTTDSLRPKVATLDVSYLYGSILLHNPDISHLITHHPKGILLSYNRKTYGEEEWQSRYGFPDWQNQRCLSRHGEYISRWRLTACTVILIFTS